MKNRWTHYCSIVWISKSLILSIASLASLEQRAGAVGSPVFSLNQKQVKEGSLVIVSAVASGGAKALEGWTAVFEGKVSPFFLVSSDSFDSLGSASASAASVLPSPHPSSSEFPFPSVVGSPVAGPVLHWMALLAVSHHHPPGVGVISMNNPMHPDTPAFTLSLKIVSGHYKTENLKVKPAFSSPSPEDLKVIQADQQEVGELYKKMTPQKRWSGHFIFPIASKITSPFGTNRVFNHELQSYHSGLDLRAPLKTPVRAPAAGTVVLAKSLFFTGNTIILDHGYGLFTVYAHLSQMQVQVGDAVKLHTILGLSGQTGRVKGPHLHWGVVVNGIKVNPMDVITDLK